MTARRLANRKAYRGKRHTDNAVAISMKTRPRLFRFPNLKYVIDRGTRYPRIRNLLQRRYTIFRSNLRLVFFFFFSNQYFLWLFKQTQRGLRSSHEIEI